MRFRLGNPGFKPLVIELEDTFEVQVLAGLVALMGVVNTDKKKVYLAALFDTLDSIVFIEKADDETRVRIKRMLDRIEIEVTKHLGEYSKGAQ